MSMSEIMSLHSSDIEDYALRRRRLQPYSFEELKSLPSVPFLIKDLLPQGGFSAMNGASNSGKTFTAIDLCMSVALGRKWRGKHVQKGCVLYVAAEAGLSIVRRLKAFAKYHGLTDITNFHLITASVDLCNTPDDTEEIIAEAQKLGDVALIVVDTLSRALAGANENSPEGMGAFIRKIDLIRKMTGAHVHVVHHLGKDPLRGGRGHSSFRAAVDTEFEVVQDAKPSADLLWTPAFL